MATLVAGADSGVTGTNASFTHIPLTVNLLTSDFKNNHSFVHLQGRNDVLKTNIFSDGPEHFLHCHPRVRYATAPITEQKELAVLALEQMPYRLLLSCTYGRKKKV